jgi:hypothetical protein
MYLTISLFFTKEIFKIKNLNVNPKKKKKKLIFW